MFAVVVFAVLCCSAVSARDSRIVNGEIAGENEFPHQVSLASRPCVKCGTGDELRNGQCCLASWPLWCAPPKSECAEYGETYSHFCGGALIAANWVVTAAHCVDGTAVRSIEAFVGVHDRSDKGDTHKTNPSEIIIHPLWNEGTGAFPNDVAMIKLGRPVATTAAVKPINLADKTDGDFAGQECAISGWGRLSGGGNLPMELQKAYGNILTNAVCASEHWGNNINDGHICIHEDTSGACNGDSGGPLTCNNTLAGVTSWGRSGCDTASPSVYTRISVFRDWIDGVMGTK